MSLSASLDCPIYEPVSAPSQFANVAPLVSEKTPEPFQSLSSDLGWRTYFGNLGIKAAIISYVTQPPGAGRHAYIIGFDEARQSTPLADGLIAYAEYAWKTVRDNDIVTFRVATGPACNGVEPIAPALGPLGEKIIGKLDHVAAVRTTIGGATFSALLFRTPEGGGFSTSCKRALIDILPVLSRSASGDVAAARNDRHAKMLEAMFDRVSLATFLVDLTGRPLFCNAAGNAMLDQRTPLLRSADGTIVCWTQAATRDFRAAIRAAATALDPDQAEIVLRLDTRNGECRLAFVVPAVSRGGDTLSRCAMVLVHAPQTAEAPATLLEALGLLPSEQRFLSSFLRASSLNAAAEDSGLSEETARTYLKRVRAKLGVHRQMELAQLIYGLVPPLRQFCSQPAE